MKYKEFVIDKNYETIYYFLKDEGFSENYITQLRKTWGNFIVNDKIVNIRKRLIYGDVLKINSNPIAKTKIKTCILPLDIVYEDEYYLLVNKPSGISCMPNKSHYDFNLAGGICEYMSKKDENFVLRIINRLDKDVCGIIVIAKDKVSQSKLKILNKTYYAVCEGKIDEEKTIDCPIKTLTADGINQIKRVISIDGQPAKTFVKPVCYNDKMSLVRINIEQGRTHQIRLHLASINHPLVGDILYGKRTDIISHTALICKELSFFHPFINKELRFDIEFPQDMQRLIKASFN